MHSRRLACLLLGLWLGAGLAMALVTLDGSRSVAGFYTEAWAVAQIALGGSLFFFLLFATGEGKYTLLVSLLMLGSVLVQQALLMPGLSMPARAGAGYWALEVAKMAMGLALAVRLVLRRGPSGHARKQFDLIDEGNHGHIDR